MGGGVRAGQSPLLPQTPAGQAAQTAAQTFPGRPPRRRPPGCAAAASGSRRGAPWARSSPRAAAGAGVTAVPRGCSVRDPQPPCPPPRPGHWPCCRLPGALGPPVPGASAPLAPHPAAPGPAGSRLPARRVGTPVLGPEGESGGPRAPRPRRPPGAARPGGRTRFRGGQPRRPGRPSRSAGDTWCHHLQPRARGLRRPSPERGAHGQLVSPLALVSFPSNPSPSARAFSVLPGVALRSRAGRTRRPPWARRRGQSLTFLLSPGIRPHTDASPSAYAASFPRPPVPSRVPHGAWVTPVLPLTSVAAGSCVCSPRSSVASRAGI